MIVARVIMPFLITSLSANAGIIGHGLANLPILLLPGMDGAMAPRSSTITARSERLTSEYGWKLGIYRGPAAETLRADFSNVQITTGPQAAPTSGTSSSSLGDHHHFERHDLSRVPPPHPAGRPRAAPSSSGSTGDRLKR
jgi:hypothetical protein